MIFDVQIKDEMLTITAQLEKRLFRTSSGKNWIYFTTGGFWGVRDEFGNLFKISINLVSKFDRSELLTQEQIEDEVLDSNAQIRPDKPFSGEVAGKQEQIQENEESSIDGDLP